MDRGVTPLGQWWRRIQELFFKKGAQGDGDGTSQTNRTKHNEKDLSFSHWILILIALGVAVMILANFFAEEKERTGSFSNLPLVEDQGGSDRKDAAFAFGPKSDFKTMAEYEEELENQLKEMLSKIKGVGEVSVMVNLDSSTETVVEKNRRTHQSETIEEDREGGKRQIKDQERDEQVVILRQGDTEEPVVIKTNKPRVRGVLVVAQGAQNVQVKAWIAEAVQRVLDVPAHKVSVLPKNE